MRSREGLRRGVAPPHGAVPSARLWCVCECEKDIEKTKQKRKNKKKRKIKTFLLCRVYEEKTVLIFLD